MPTAQFIDASYETVKECKCPESGEAIFKSKEDFVKECEELELDSFFEQNADKTTFAPADFAGLEDQGLIKLNCLVFPSQLKSIEVPKEGEKGYELAQRLSVLDVGQTAIESLEFVKKLPNLISIGVLGCPNIKEFSQFECLKDHPNLQIIDVDTAEKKFGCESSEEFRKKVFELSPQILAVDNTDREGNSYGSDSEEEESMDLEGIMEDKEKFKSFLADNPGAVEELMALGGEMEEEDEDELESVEEEDEGVAEEEKTAEDAEEADEPEAKRQKVDA